MNENRIRRSNEWLADLSQFIKELSVMRSEMLRFESSFQTRIQDLHDSHKYSAANLLHYLALRSRDIRQLQARLASVGLSSLGRAESHALVSVEAVLRILFQLT
ncbi:MAG TPA: pyruvate kinase, partial [Blastocatellia bacterium]|nr:pyruvate kinase [Blastocatellia bacterium]